MPSKSDSNSRRIGRWVAIVVCVMAGTSAIALAQNYRSTLVLAPYSLSFGDVLVGRATDAQTITLLNTGPVPARVDKISITGPFTEVNNCPAPPATLGNNQTCGIEVTFKPGEAAAATGTVSVFHDGRPEPFVVSLQGNGTLDASAVKFSPAAVNFDEEKVGDVSRAQTITLTNAGQKVLFITGISTEGDFTLLPSSTCEKVAGALPPNGSCTLVVTFTPLEMGPRQGTIVVKDDAEDSPQRVQLSGRGEERQ